MSMARSSRLNDEGFTLLELLVGLILLSTISLLTVQSLRSARLALAATERQSAEAVVEAAEMVGSPVIIGFGGVMMEPGWFDRGGGLERLGALGLTAGRLAKVPVSVLLNEVATLDLIQ